MIQPFLKYYTERLVRRNYKTFYLGLLRVGLSLWLLKEVCINWTSMEVLFGQSVFVASKNNLLARLPGGFSFVQTHYMHFIMLYIVVLILNILGIGRWLTALFLFLMVYVLQNMDMTLVNGGDMMARMISFYLVFANSYQHFALFPLKQHGSGNKIKIQNLISNLAALSIMIQLCLAYFASGVAKLNDPLWLHGQGTYYALSMERFMGTPLNRYIVQYKWINLTSNYAVLLFQLLFPLLVWFKKLRKTLLVTGVVFHLLIYVFLMIYGFQIVFLLTYGLFLANDKLHSFFSPYLKSRPLNAFHR